MWYPYIADFACSKLTKMDALLPTAVALCDLASWFAAFPIFTDTEMQVTKGKIAILVRLASILPHSSRQVLQFRDQALAQAIIL